MDKRKVAKRIIEITENETNNYDAFDRIMDLLEKAFPDPDIKKHEILFYNISSGNYLESKWVNDEPTKDDLNDLQLIVARNNGLFYSDCYFVSKFGSNKDRHRLPATLDKFLEERKK